MCWKPLKHWVRALHFLFKLAILLICHWLAPFIRYLLARYFNCQMWEPAVRCCSVPMLNFCWNINAVPWIEFYSLFSFFLIVTTSSYAYKNLSAATLRVMYMPVISALNWTTSPQSLVVAGFNGIHICALCESVLTSSFCQVIFLFLPRSKPLLQGWILPSPLAILHRMLRE